VRVTLEKLAGVESVEVSLNEGRARIQMRPGNAVTMAQIRQAVERNGFTPQQAGVSARADVLVKGETLQLRIVGTNETYEVAGTPQADDIRQQLRNQAGKTVVVDGVVPMPRNKRGTLLIQVKRFQQA